MPPSWPKLDLLFDQFDDGALDTPPTSSFRKRSFCRHYLKLSHVPRTVPYFSTALILLVEPLLFQIVSPYTSICAIAHIFALQAFNYATTITFQCLNISLPELPI